MGASKQFSGLISRFRHTLSPNSSPPSDPFHSATHIEGLNGSKLPERSRLAPAKCSIFTAGPTRLREFERSNEMRDPLWERYGPIVLALAAWIAVALIVAPLALVVALPFTG